MGVVVSFDYNKWLALFPEFTNVVSSDQAQQYFDIATTIHRNDGGGPVGNQALQLSLLNMVTAHIAKLFAPPAAGQQPNDLVGRVNSASQGSVSVQVAYSNNVSEQQAWFIQTKYGAMYWTASAPFRTMRYIPSLRQRGTIGPRGLSI